MTIFALNVLGGVRWRRVDDGDLLRRFLHRLTAATRLTNRSNQLLMIFAPMVLRLFLNGTFRFHSFVVELNRSVRLVSTSRKTFYFRRFARRRVRNVGVHRPLFSHVENFAWFFLRRFLTNRLMFSLKTNEIDAFEGNDERFTNDSALKARPQFEHG